MLSDVDIVECGVLFIREVRAVVASNNIPPDRIFSLDETAVFLDDYKRSTIAMRGAHDVPICSHGHEKHRVTAVFCASAAGDKLRPCVMVKKARAHGELPVTTRNGVMGLKMDTSWINPEAFVAYLDALFPVQLAPDSARCHTAASVQQYLSERGILSVVVPDALTGFYQPADFRWFGPSRAVSLRQWMNESEMPHNFTAGGRVRPPSSDVVASWLTRAWSSMRASTVVARFSRCMLGDDADLHLMRHECLGTLFRDALQVNAPQLSLQHLLDEFDDIAIVDE